MFGVSAYFDELVKVAQKVSYGRDNVATAAARYGYFEDRIYIYDAENPEGGIGTLIHEATHALDDDRNWTPGLVPTVFQLDRVEGVGYTATFLLGPEENRPTIKLREFEALFETPIADDVVVRRLWNECIRVMRNVMNQQLQANRVRTVSNDDVRALKEDVGLSFIMTALMARYQRELNERGVSVLLESSFPDGPSRIGIPDGFLE